MHKRCLESEESKQQLYITRSFKSSQIQKQTVWIFKSFIGAADAENEKDLATITEGDGLKMSSKFRSIPIITLASTALLPH